MTFLCSIYSAHNSAVWGFLCKEVGKENNGYEKSTIKHKWCVHMSAYINVLLECACNLLFWSNKMWLPCKKYLNFCLFYLTVCCLEYPKTKSFSRCITHLVPAFSRRLLLFLLNENLTSNRHIWSITKQFNRLNLKMTKPDFG